MPITHLWRIKYRLHEKSFTFTISLLMTLLFTLQPQFLTRSLNGSGLRPNRIHLLYVSIY